MVNRYLSTSEVAKILGVSRVAVFNMIKKGKLKAMRVGRLYAVPEEELGGALDKKLNQGQKAIVDRAVDKVVSEYGETLKLLGNS